MIFGIANDKPLCSWNRIVDEHIHAGPGKSDHDLLKNRKTIGSARNVWKKGINASNSIWEKWKRIKRHYGLLSKVGNTIYLHCAWHYQHNFPCSQHYFSFCFSNFFKARIIFQTQLWKEVASLSLDEDIILNAYGSENHVTKFKQRCKLIFN